MVLKASLVVINSRLKTCITLERPVFAEGIDARAIGKDDTNRKSSAEMKYRLMRRNIEEWKRAEKQCKPRRKKQGHH
jgi:hypothetical protein